MVIIKGNKQLQKILRNIDYAVQKKIGKKIPQYVQKNNCGM